MVEVFFLCMDILSHLAGVIYFYSLVVVKVVHFRIEDNSFWTLVRQEIESIYRGCKIQ
jgi:hypothetical protein